MTVSAYQIQNILQTYNRQLKAKLSDRVSGRKANPALPKDVVEISTEGKKKYILERVGTEAVENLKRQALEPYKAK